MRSRNDDGAGPIFQSCGLVADPLFKTCLLNMRIVFDWRTDLVKNDAFKKFWFGMQKGDRSVVMIFDILPCSRMVITWVIFWILGLSL